MTRDLEEAPPRRARLKLGLAGCGQLATSIHLRILARLPGVELVALAEADPRRREEACRLAPGAAAFADYAELLEMPEVEAVVICLPNTLHAAAATAALDRGRHVYLEKPLATSLEEGRGVLSAWRRAGTTAMIGFNYRFNALYAAAGRCLDSGRLGELVAARSVFCTAEKALPPWKRTRGSGGGVLLDLGSHHVDLVRFLFGRKVRGVFAKLWSRRCEGDCAMLELQLAGGVSVQSFFSTCAIEEDRFEIYGRAGKLTVDRYRALDVEVVDPTLELARVKRLWHGARVLPRAGHLLEKLRAPGHEPSYGKALARFVSAARAGLSARPDFRDGYQSLAVVAAAEASAAAGRPVSLPHAREESSVLEGSVEEGPAEEGLTARDPGRA